MSGTVAVHQCLFCPQTFGSAVEKDDHILEHFAQETCTDCDQSLIRIGSNLYTLHNAVTCIKRESKPDVSIQHDSQKGLINQHDDEGDYNASITSSNKAYEQQMCIKNEPEVQDEPFTCINVVETCYIEDHQRFSNQNSGADDSAFELISSNTDSVHQMEIKMEPGAQVEQYISVDMNDLTGPNNVDIYSSQVVQSRRFECDICKTRVKTEGSLRRHTKMKHTNCIKYKCDFCWAVFLSKKSLENHLPHCKRPKKSIYMTRNLRMNTQGILCAEESHVEKTQDEQSMVVYLENFTDTSNTDVDSSRLFENKSAEKSCEASRKRNYKDDRVPCDICGEMFLPFFLGRHKKYKHRPEADQCTDRLDCEICKRVLNNKKALQQHMRLKHPNPHKTIFKCEFCCVVLMSKKSLDNHHLFRCKRIKKSLNENPGGDVNYTEKTLILENNENCDEKDKYCEICDKTFTRRNCAERHKFRVHKIGGHHCINCRQVFHTFSGLINHGPKCIHNSNATFECHICHNIYHSKRYLRFHIKSVHVLEIEKKFKCEMCGKGFHLMAKYEDHRNRQHFNLDIRNFMCSTCGRAFTTKQCLWQHELIHTGERPLKCKFEECNKTFRTHSAKYAHLKMHRGQKMLQCKTNVHGIPK